MFDSHMLQETEHEHDLIRCTRLWGHSISVPNVSCSSFRDEPFDDLHSASSLRADTVASMTLARACEAPNIDILSTPEAAGSDPPVNFRAASDPPSVPDAPTSVSRVFARRKPARGEEVRGTDQTLVLTLENISPLFHLPLGHAAEQLGLCRTALKNVCRKCGVMRWPFRGRGRREATASPPSPRDQLSHLPKSRQELSSAGPSSPGHSGAAAVAHAPAAYRAPVHSIVVPVPAARGGGRTSSQHRKREAPADSDSAVQRAPRSASSSAEPFPGAPPAFSFAHSYTPAPQAYTPAAWGAGEPAAHECDGWLPARAANASGAGFAAGGCCSGAAEDVGCDLSFLCTGLEAVQCHPG
ncbi:hypothetical protein T484DRAFT_1909715 [Baffinella frigidus]|nr:hypothetical protein T484DRAFT_1909715 [Cryptophyta sp. CCMP2293]